MNDEIFNEIKDKFNAFIEEDRTLKYLLVNAENLQGAAEFLKERGYEHLSFVTAIDRQNELEAVYLLSSYVEGNYNSVALKVKSNSSDAGGATGTKTEISDENFIVPTLTEIFNSADWHERETYDMFGIKFNGHKNLKRILLPTQFIGHPLRKSYPLGKEQEISLYGDFEATKDELTVDKFLKDEDKKGKTYSTQLMHLNVGPHHPSTHGVLRLMMIIDGEKMLKIEPVIGYLHRGIEKICENLNYTQIVPYMDRLDYVASMMNEFPYVLAVEKLMNIQVPERAQIIRVIVTELNRIASHIMWFTTWLMDLGATTPFFYGFNDREQILEIFEDLSRARMMFSYMCIGGVKKDINADIAKKINKFTDEMPARIAEYHDLITGNEIFLGRAKGIGILTKKDAINFGVTGPMLRASGVHYDVRRDEPYSMYEKFKFNVPVYSEGDNFVRYMVRMEEMEESVKIVEQGLNLITSTTEGEIIARVPRMITPPKGSVYAKTEHAKGEMGIFIVSDGKPKPYRFKIRSPAFSNLCALPRMCENNYVADVVAIGGSIDPVMGCVDR